MVQDELQVGYLVEAWIEDEVIVIVKEELYSGYLTHQIQLIGKEGVTADLYDCD